MIRKLLLIRICLLLVMQLLLCNLYAQSLTIVSESSSAAVPYPPNAIYPAFVDNMEYNSWTESGKNSYFQLKATGGASPYTWSVTSGSLPGGLSLTTDGKIQGTPTTEGDFTFTAQVKDASNVTVSKQLIMKAAPYRSKWMTDSKFGIMLQWGVPKLTAKADIATFEAGITPLFNAEAWVDSIKNMGAKVLNFYGKDGNGIRYWPSTSPSKLGYKTSRDIVGELLTACHAKGVKFVAYFAPDHGWPKNNALWDSDSLTTDVHIGTGVLNTALIRELIAMGVDGVWIDMGATAELYPASVNPAWFPWGTILPVIRSINPFATFVANSGVGNGDTVLHWPDTDIIVYENSVSWAPAVAVQNSTNKKMALEVDNLLDNSWAWTWPVDNYGGSAKTSADIIESIKRNWRVGATYMLNYPALPNGTLIPTQYRQTLKDIGEFVKANQGWSITPTSSLAPGHYNTAQTVSLNAPNATIYYTLDGSYPTKTSTQYIASSPLHINKNTRLRAISVEQGKGESLSLDVYYSIGPETLENLVKLLSGITGGESITDVKEYYRGIKFTVGHQSVLLKKIGRYFAPANAGKHNILIKKYEDDEILRSTSIDMNIGNADGLGYKYVDIMPVVLQAGKTYIIASKENSIDKYLNTPISKSVLDKNFNKLVKFNLNPNGGKKLVVEDGNGQLLNMVYQTDTVVVEPTNLAFGAATYLQDNNSQHREPSVVVKPFYAENAVDDDPETSAAATVSYAWTLHTDLGRVHRNINKVKIDFDESGYSTEFQVWGAKSNSWELLYSKTNNEEKHHQISFPAKDLRYIRVRSLKPDTANQVGEQMRIVKLGVYSDPNLAVGTDVFLQSNSGSSLGASENLHVAKHAIDGDLNTRAQAGGQFPWTLLTDLGRTYNKLTRVRINFAEPLFSTDYIIQTSKDNVNWPDTVAVVSNNGVAPNPVNYNPDHWFAPREARYVRVRSLKPNAPGQLGFQMAIAELGVFESTNLAATPEAKLYLQKNDGNPVPGSPQISSTYTALPELAIDTDLTTAAVASLSWDWTFFTDLDKVYQGINKINIDFLANGFATEYKVFASSNKINWVEVKHVTGNSNLQNYHTFSQPFEARYIGIKAVLPNGAGQTGTQMSIAELGIYSDYSVDCNFTPSALVSNSNPAPGSAISLSYACSGSGCNGVTYSWSGNSIDGSSQPLNITAPSTAGTYTYTLTSKKTSCPDKTSTVNIVISPIANPCNFTDKGIVGTWSGLNVQTRQFIVNGTFQWLLVVAPTGSSVDKHFPKGANFAERNDILWDNGAISKSCLGDGDTGFYGLDLPSGITIPAGYTQASEIDGAKYFHTGGSARIGVKEDLLVSTGLQNIESPPKESAIQITPNPNTGIFEVVFSLEKGKSATLSVVDIQGKTISDKTVLGKGAQKEKINIANYGPGTYMIILRKERGVEAVKTVVVK
ncbi:discoidin domain-containing protein [Dyadobacter luteus]|nr:discoidin domain-containing protein [Dyadobacter luteus]